MKGNKISDKNYIDLGLGGTVDGFGGMLFDNSYDERLVARFGEDDDDLIVDTAFASDTGYFETGIIDKRYYNSWIIVDEYRTKKEALVGHKKWVKTMKKNPPNVLKDIHGDFTYKREDA